MTPEPNQRSANAPRSTRTLQIDLTRRRRLLASLGGNHVRFCYQCGACVGDCPSARFDPAFNPREIMLTALLGAHDDLLAPGSVVWKCSNCYNCYERCPQDVRPVEVILALKNLARETGAQPAAVAGVVEMIVKTGRSAPMLATLARKREAMGLPPISPVAVDELQALLAPDEEAREVPR
jgi:heterodisulfide reductase subunit C